MPILTCPQCGVQLHADDVAGGAAVACGRCGATIYLARPAVEVAPAVNAAPAVDAEPALPAIRVASTPAAKRHKKSTSFQIVRYGVHAAISCASLYLGRLRKTGNLAVAEFEMRYVLPSGDREAMTQSRGDRKMTELGEALAEAEAASAELRRLRREVTRLERALGGARNDPHGFYKQGVWVEDPTSVALKSERIATFQRELADVNAACINGACSSKRQRFARTLPKLKQSPSCR